MKRETRLNLIFIAVLLAVSLPGAVMLAKKKMEPGARRMGQPDPVRRSIPYMDPAPVPSIMTRTSPPMSQRWVRELGRTLAGEPHLSKARWFEVLDQRRQGDELHLAVLVWQHEPGTTYRATVAGKPSRVGGVREVQVPAEILEELRREGYIRPPATVAVVEVITAPTPPATDGKLDLILSGNTSKGERSDIVTLFTRADATEK